ncbi:uncharacterized protein DEA37_0013544 [Paragonimus westermani]|uniref:Uncharacterized protein n=1 Tax=Paragonimus westermani TaxID=34504 RepID=A0A5J4N3D2_9TREM|nr:uncharacterized protein DEA37_0013544 [Paragonimus westermani]
MAAARVTELIIQSSCPSSEWMCRDGQCVASHRFCDGRVDCRDGSDEREPHCVSADRCRPGQFLCRSGECISADRRCNGRQDCYDGSDETDCGEFILLRMQPQLAHTEGSLYSLSHSDRIRSG